MAEPSAASASANSSEAEEQNARFLLRERYLYLLSSISQSKNEVDLRMYENTHVTARIRATDAAFDNIVVEDLKTPTQQTIPHAILRTGDIISMTVERDDNSLLKLSK